MKLLILALAMVTLVALVAAKPGFGLREADIQELKELLMELNEEKKEEFQAEIPYDAPHYKISTKRSLYKRSEADCATICKPVHLPSEKSEACTTKFAPEYEVVSGCECLKDYKCCPATCKAADMSTCNTTTTGWGYFYPSKDVDCCGCDIVKCNPCEAPVPKDEECADKEFPVDECYTYTKEAQHNDEDGCYRSICPINIDPKHPAPPCNTNCETIIDGVDTCGYKSDTCEDSKNTCPLEEVVPETELGLDCYEITDIDSTGYKHSGEAQSCEKCTELEANKKSCAAKDAAADALNCHQFGESGFDVKCWTKIYGKDECLCTTSDCESASEECQEVFANDEVCPKGHVKKSGVAICGQAREICIPCPTVVPTCDAHEALVDATDADGCAIKRCKTVVVDETKGACLDATKFVVTPTGQGVFAISCHVEAAAAVAEELVAPPPQA